MVGSTGQVVAAVDDAVRAGKRIAVRSGGHCFEDFVDHPEIQVLIDTSEMKSVYYDPVHQAFAVEAGATLNDVYPTLFLGWGVTITAGWYGNVCVGGHVAGGGYGPACRQHGITVDHLYAVEIVTVDRSGRVRAVVASRRRDDPNRELWWAHTGGGGGNLGIVIRYWFRSPHATGKDPSRILPRPPATVLKNYVTWSWDDLDEPAFTRLVRNHGEWHRRNSAPNSPYASLWSVLSLTHRVQGQLGLKIQLDGTLPNARQLMDDYVRVLNDGVGVPHISQPYTMPW